jgi:transcriptional regulator with XRE-family HTH domain
MQRFLRPTPGGPTYRLVIEALEPETFRLINLERVRLVSGFTREALAERSSVSAETIKKQESANGPAASLETAWKLSRALGVDIDILLLPVASGETLRGVARRKSKA